MTYHDCSAPPLHVHWIAVAPAYALPPPMARHSPLLSFTMRIHPASALVARGAAGSALAGDSTPAIVTRNVAAAMKTRLNTIDLRVDERLCESTGS